MGGFLDKPKTEKTTESGSGNGLQYGVVSMQGWRVEMEDSHSAVTGLDGDYKGMPTAHQRFISYSSPF